MKYWFLILSMWLGASALQGKTVTLTDTNTLQMNGYYTPESVSLVMQKALELDAILPKGEPLYLVIHSGGGYISAGFSLIEMLNGLDRKVHTITMTAASMGFETVQALKGKRYMLKSGTLMSHRARGGFYGEFPNGNLDSRYKYWLQRLLAKDLAVVSRNEKMKSIKQYQALIANEYWCGGASCKSEGFADEVIEARCDKSLGGTTMVHTNTDIQGYPVVMEQEYSDCPLQPYVLSWNIYYKGKSLWQKPQASTDANNLRGYNPTLFGDRATTQKVLAGVRKYREKVNSLEPVMEIK